ncbi:MAG: hypothetical protein ACRDP6_03570 [Actinoallomurus sp.]
MSAEVDEMETGWDQLTWALGVLPLVLVERGVAMRHTWRPRLVWLASAGGLGGLRVYGPAMAAGVLMVVWSWGRRGADEPVPFFAALIFAPLYVLRGLLTGRRRQVGIGAAVGATTALVGFAVVTLATVVYVGVTDSAFTSVAWVFFGLGFGIPVAAVGAMCGLVGAALAHPTVGARSIRHAFRDQWRSGSPDL